MKTIKIANVGGNYLRLNQDKGRNPVFFLVYKNEEILRSKIYSFVIAEFKKAIERSKNATDCVLSGTN